MVNGINNDLHITEALQELILFTGKQEMFSEFNEDVFRRFVDRMTLSTRTEVVFHLKCGLMWLVNLVCPTKVQFSLSKHGLI